MNITELRAAAERYRDYQAACQLAWDKNQPVDESIILNWSQTQADMKLLADYAATELAKVREDDGELVTEDWLDGTFKQWTFHNSWGWEVMTNCVIRKTAEGFFPVLSYTGQGPTGAQLETRHDVRRLAEVLGIELNESN